MFRSQMRSQQYDHCLEELQDPSFGAFCFDTDPAMVTSPADRSAKDEGSGNRKQFCYNASKV